ncbi:tetratricopeptide repeat protein [Bacteroides sp. 51]|uniref:tetratricopeptide repeat protein n=1 Tax=Bacteroides sp. 51 TaxID=2302938 RepID=UPI0013D25DAF|nr:tetratricopeptide repeat protein [Bacteroides sp. 51]NDV81457.1 tetratricopeptide repeat protein [Bacteroides sp. 51]
MDDSKEEKKDDLDRIRRDIKEGRLDSAIRNLANRLIIATISPGPDKSELYYLLGNACRKKGDFHLAMDFYTRAIEENPDSPAVEARKVLQGIMNFYNKDMYNH